MTPYCVPEQRELSASERAFLDFLLRSCAPERLPELEGLSVIARCGCGQCPGVLFGTSSTDQPVKQGAQIIADMMTPKTPLGFVSVMLWATDTRITELEFASFGDLDVAELPLVSDLSPFVTA